MAESRMLEITIQVEDDGYPESYDKILEALASIGATIDDEREI